MADPITALGAAGAAANIIDVLNSTILSLRGLRAQWKDADFEFLNLMAQLLALKAAVEKIQEWISNETLDPHHQLVMDLSLSLTCCRALTGRMDSQLSQLRFREDTKLDVASKVKLVLGSQPMVDIQKMLERQTQAMTLLLTACNSLKISQQGAILAKSSTRKVMRRIKDDSSSLCCHRDATSFRSSLTDSLSKLSLNFSFDKELLQSNVYQHALRGSFKERIRQLQADKQEKVIRDRQQLVDELIVRDLEKYKLQRGKGMDILLLGDIQRGNDVLGTMLEFLQDPLDQPSRSEWRKLVVTLTAQAFEKLVNSDLVSKIETESILIDQARKQVDRILNGSVDQFRVGSFAKDSVQELQKLWKLLDMRRLEEIWPSIPGLTVSHLSAVRSLPNAIDFKYQPTNAEVVSIRKERNQVGEFKIMVGNFTHRVIDLKDP